MRTELFSVRQSTEELSLLNRDLKKIVTELDKKASLRVLFKTEIDCNPKKIQNDLLSSLASDNPPELYIYVNALDTHDNSSFCRLFGPVIKKFEKDLDQKEVAEDGKTRLYPHIKVYSLEGLSGDYPGYCFVARNKKIIALPRISLVGGSLSDFLCTAVNCAKEIFSKAFTECPEGYVLLPKQPKSKFVPMHMQQDTPPAKEVLAVKEETAENTDYHADEPVIPAEEESSTAQEITDSAAQKADTEAEPIGTLADEIISSAAKTNAAKITADASAKTDTVEDSSLTEVKSEDAPANGNDSKDISESDEVADSEDNKESQKKKSGIKGFFRSFIPMKGDEPKAIAMKVVVLAAIATFLVAIGMLLNFYVIEPWINNTDIDEIQSIFYNDEETVVTDASGDEVVVNKSSKNWKGLQKINKEIVGWIKIDNTEIDFPVLFHKEDNQDGQFYLYRNYKKEPSDFGSIFVDYRCLDGTNSKQVILHGHNMSSDGSMFTTLLDYSRKDGWTKGNTDYYKKAPIISFDTPEGDQDWIIFAIMKINVSNSNEAIFNYLMGDFESEAQFMNFVYNIKERSYLDVDVPINEDDRLLTLSTCSYEQENTRTVVVARQIREDEDVNKYVKSVKEGTPVKDVTSTFSTEYENGKIKWYDGDGKLKGNEEVEFLEQAEMFTVKFVDANGKTIGPVQKVIKGEDATAPTGEAPRKASDGTYYYVFQKWDKSYKNVTENLTIKPVFTKHKLDIPVETTRQTDPEEEPVAPTVTPKPTQAPTQAPSNPPVTNAPATLPVATDPVEVTAAQ